MTKNLILLLILVCIAVAPHVKLGNWDSEKKQWNGYNPACDEQCKQLNGTICGDNVRQCCVKNKCKNKLGFKICQQQLEDFTCDQGKRKRTLDQYLNQHNITPN